MAFSVLALALAVLVAAPLTALGGGGGDGDKNKADSARVRWDIVQLSPGASGTIDISRGGKASAKAESTPGNTANPNRITVTGSGTFRPGKSGGVTGGGMWWTSGQEVGVHSGTYRVTALVSWLVAPGTVPSPPLNDKITGHAEDARAGLAVLRVAYSDGSDGILVVSCHLPVGSPDSIFEGITASKGFVDFWNREGPTGGPSGANENRTQFHVLRGGDSEQKGDNGGNG